MKMMTIYEAKNHFSKTVKAAKKDVVIVTRRGKPVAAIQAVTENDIEDFLLERSEKFWKMIKHARGGESMPLETVRHKLGL